jgi:glucosamine-phosphate N-acetyltransferase
MYYGTIKIKIKFSFVLYYIQLMELSNKNEIRSIQIRDYHKNYVELLNQLSQTSFTYDQFENFIGNNNNIIIKVIEKNNKIIATGTLVVENKLIHNISKAGHIEDIIIDKDHRGMGYGLKIILHLMNLGKEVGCYKVILNCKDELVGFYDKCGLQRKGSQMIKYFDLADN